jgi:hypothetical protein
MPCSIDVTILGKLFCPNNNNKKKKVKEASSRNKPVTQPMYPYLKGRHLSFQK